MFVGKYFYWKLFLLENSFNKIFLFVNIFVGKYFNKIFLLILLILIITINIVR